MARMVWGQWASSESPAPKAEHFVASKVRGSKTACGRPFKGAMFGWKEWKMVTCKQCRAQMPEGAK